MKICFFGTSFLAALQAGHSLIRETPNKIEADFFGVSAPKFARTFYEGGVRSEKKGIFIDQSTPVFFKSRGIDGNERVPGNWAGMKQSENTFIDLSRYDAVVLVGIYHRYRVLPWLRVDDNGFFYQNGTPISKDMFNTFQLFGVEMKDHPWVGTIPFQESRNMIRMFSSNIEHVFLLPAPHPPLNNIKAQIDKFGLEKIANDYLALECLFREQVRDLRVHMLEQEETTITSNVATLDTFSRGKHSTTEDLLDPHMNELFGEIQVKKTLQDVLYHLNRP